jgi:hypothetical protein
MLEFVSKHFAHAGTPLAALDERLAAVKTAEAAMAVAMQEQVDAAKAAEAQGPTPAIVESN